MTRKGKKNLQEIAELWAKGNPEVPDDYIVSLVKSGAPPDVIEEAKQEIKDNTVYILFDNRQSFEVFCRCRWDRNEDKITQINLQDLQSILWFLDYEADKNKIYQDMMIMQQTVLSHV